MKAHRFSIQTSITTRLFSVVFSFYFLVTILVTALQMITEYNHTKSKILDELKIIQRAWEPGLSATLWHFNQSQLSQIAGGLMSLPMIIGVKLEDDMGKIVHSSGVIVTSPGNNDFEPILSHEFDLIYEEEIMLYEGTETVTTKERSKIGEGTFYFSHEVVIDRVKYGFLLIIINAMVKTVALWTIFLIVARRFLGKPLESLIDLTQEIRLDNLEQTRVALPTQGRNELKIFEESFNSMLQKLLSARRELQEKTKEVEEKNKKLEELDRLKDEFMAKTSHELHTPLHGILGIAQSLVESPTPPPTETVRENLMMIVDSGRRLSRLVEDIMDFAKMKHHTLILKRQAVDVHQVVEIVIRLSNPLTENKIIQVDNLVPLQLPPAYADEDRLQQIFHNLIGNAIKFTENGAVAVCALQKEEFIEITVVDTGIGIPEEKLSLIFESFEQVEASLARSHEGLGLGLSIAKQLVEMHGGTLEVRSIPEIGSLFTFTLPIAEPETTSAPIEVETTPDAANLQPEVSLPENLIDEGDFCILAVDDDPTNLQVIANYLVAQNYTPICFPSAPEALNWIEQNGKPDLVLLDIMMPHMNGFDACRKLRELYEINDLPLIFLTASHRRGDMETGFELGANDFLTKPFDQKELLARMHAHLQVLTAQEQLISLREVANQIAEFQDRRQMFQMAIEKMQQTRLLSEVVLFREGELEVAAPENFAFLNHFPESEVADMPQEYGVSVINYIRAGHPIYEFYKKASGGSFTGGHFAFLRPEDIKEICICLYRSPSKRPFDSLEQQYLINMLQQLQRVENNVQTMLNDKLIQVLPEIQPNLSKITHICADGSYCQVYFEDKRNPKMLHVSLSSLDFYFDNHALLKIHKSHLINPNKIMGIQKSLVRKRNYQYEVLVGNDQRSTTLRVGKTFVPRLNELVPQYFNAN